MSDNPQFKRTDKAIVYALISLLKRKPFEKITVQDILDETPVTRATFYAHFRDKYEIAEKMLEHFIEVRGNVRKQLAESDSAALDRLNRSYSADKEFAQALINIHTENVDLRKALAIELEKEYLQRSDTPTREIEAKIYAQAYVELYLSLIREEQPNFTPEHTFNIFIPVAIGMLHLNNDPETRRFLEDKIAKKLDGKDRF